MKHVSIPNHSVLHLKKIFWNNFEKLKNTGTNFARTQTQSETEEKISNPNLSPIAANKLEPYYNLQSYS